MTLKKKILMSGIFFLTFFLVAQTVQAAMVTLSAIDSGFYTSTGLHQPGNQNYIVGRDEDGLNRHNFFVFDLASISDAIIGAQLRLFNPAGGYLSPDPSETYRLLDVSTDINTLRAGGADLTEGQSIFDDLGTGIPFGEVKASLADNDAIIDISLNKDALSALNAATGLFALGGAISTLTHVGSDEFLFVNTTVPTLTKELVLTSSAPIPEPGTLLLIGCGLVGIGVGTRRRNRRK